MTKAVLRPLKTVTPSANEASNFYFDREHGLEAVKLLPGECHVTTDDKVLVTVLGSCVTACIRDPLYGIGGMNHFMLPESGNEADGMLSASARYGSYAMELLINQLLKSGARRSALEAKVFGGGNVLKGFTVANVGERNAAFVLEYLKTEKIQIVARDLCDIYPRKVYYFPQTGRVLVKRLRSTHNDTIFKRERAYGSQLNVAPVAGDIELFG
ncbi:MAG: chemoreceptor glutamine deamidase CheD [Pseudomonadales bacterium]|nr:chemoreceptor glutamine deamidase CheD [Pseudomonadales bacterium]